MIMIVYVIICIYTVGVIITYLIMITKILYLSLPTHTYTYTHAYINNNINHWIFAEYLILINIFVFRNNVEFVYKYEWNL